METDKPIILTFVRYYLPGYKSGGPVRSISNLVEALHGRFEFRVITSDRDATEHHPYPQVKSGVWRKEGNAMVLYLSPRERTLSTIGRLLRETPHDLLYLNSFFDPDFTLKPLLARQLGASPTPPCVIAPRGEFSLGALKIGALKKSVFLSTVRLTQTYRGLSWQASSPYEAEDIKRAVRGTAAKVVVARNLPEPERVDPVTEQSPVMSDRKNSLRVCYLSRVWPKKNLAFGLRVLSFVKHPVIFNIYGIVDPSYWAECRKLIERLPTHVKVTYQGSIEHERVASTFAAHDVFLFPTLGENYGHVIAESLSAGTPVLIADTTPWRNLMDAGVGWDLPLVREQDFADRLDELAEMGADDYRKMRANCVAFARRKTRDPAALDDTTSLFLSAIAGSKS